MGKFSSKKSYYPALQEKIEETSEAFRKHEETQDTPPQVAGGLIAGEDTESFLDEVDRVQEVADIDAMTDAEEEESFKVWGEEGTSWLIMIDFLSITS